MIYHPTLLRLLDTPAGYESLGLAGPPHTGEHSSLAEELNSMRMVGRTRCSGMI